MTDFLPRLRFAKAQRVLAKQDFDRTYALRCKASDGALLVFVAANNGELTRLGLSVSRKVGNAVVRNRVKRLLREAFRLEQHRLPRGLDLVVIPLDAAKASLAAYRQGLVYLSRKLKKRLEAAPLDSPAAKPESRPRSSDSGTPS